MTSEEIKIAKQGQPPHLTIQKTVSDENTEGGEKKRL